MKHPIASLNGTPAAALGLAAAANDELQRGIRSAYEGGINFFFFYGPGSKQFIGQLATLVRMPKRREEIIITTGSGGRKRTSLLAVRRKIMAALQVDMIDLFFAEYISDQDDPKLVFGEGGVLAELQGWKSDSAIRYVGVTTHDRKLAARLAQDARVDVLMHRYNMAHRKAAREVFPVALQTQTPVVAFTATRWGTLLKPHTQWPADPPSAADCYRFCLSHPAVQVVLSAPRTVAELKANLAVLDSRRMNERDRVHWERFGDVIAGKGADAFETRWP